MPSATPTTTHQSAEREMRRFRVSDPGRTRCRTHHWVIDDVIAGDPPRQQWTCRLCQRVQWREILGEQTRRTSRHDVSSTFSAEDTWFLDPD